MARQKTISKKRITKKKKTSIGQSPLTMYGSPGPHGGNKRYKKRYRGQGNKR